MKNLSKLLERFSRALNKDALTKDAIAHVIASRIGLSVPPENVSIKDGVLSVSASAAAKNEIKLKEEGIKEELKQAHGINVIRVLYK